MISLVQSILLTLILTSCLYYFLTILYSKTKVKDKEKHFQEQKQLRSKVGVSLDDGVLYEKKYKPMSLNWLKNKTNATLKFLGGKARRGDGLVSIFSDSGEGTTEREGKGRGGGGGSGGDGRGYGSENYLTNIRSEHLDISQAIAFNSLYTWGIFEGAEISILNELCSNATIIHKKSGDIVFGENDSPSDVLYVVQSGSCDITFQGPDGIRQVIHTVHEGGVLASVADVISWITRKDTSRGGVIAQCVTDCILVVVPSPRDELGGYKSRLHTITFSRITRMLLIRFNRTTITTALFYLGLAQHFPPSFPKVDIPPELITLLENSDSSFDPNTSSSTYHQECIKYVHQAIASLYGVLPSEVELPYQKSSTTSTSETSTTTPLPLVVPLPIARAKSFSASEGTMNASDLDPFFPTPSHPTPLPSTDQTSSRGVRQRSGICRMCEGQSIFDVDPIPGLYIIVSGRVEIRYRIIQKGQPSPLMRDETLLVRESCSQLSYLSTRETSTSIVTTGDIIGHVTLLAGSSTEWYGKSDGSSVPLMSAKALTDSWLIRVPVETFDKTLTSRPDAIFDLSARMMCALPPTIRLFDFCTKWITLQGGEDIVKRDQHSTGELYIILCGRLRVLMNDQDESEGGGDERSWNTRVQGADWILTRGTLIGL
jgi:CRP-like cAMP-binding protein